MILLRSTLYFLWFVAVSVVVHIAALPVLLMPRGVTLFVARIWCRLLIWGLKVFAGLDYEVRGEVPKGGALVASKHMSMWDTLALCLLLHDARFVAKKELLSIPFYGWFLRKAGTIAIDRAGHASALRKMTVAVKAVVAHGHAVIIFPEGTRKKPGAPPDYKPGVAALYTQLGMECVPVALNSGCFWQGLTKRPGTIVIEFLPPIPPGLGRRAFMAMLQDRIETATARLVVEVG